MLTREEVVWGYRFLLGREPESDNTVVHHMNHESIEAFRNAILKCAEFSAIVARLNALSTYTGYRSEELSIFDRFASTTLQPEAGFVTDFIGSRTRISSLWDGVHHLDGTILGAPVPSDYHAETIEWLGLLKSILAASDCYAAMELGAGLGPWLVAGAVAANRVGISEIHLLGVEGDPGRFALMKQHFRDNGIDPDRHMLLHAGVGVSAGSAKWPRINEYRNIAGARPVRQSTDDATKLDTRDVDYLAGMAEELIEIDIVSLGDLLRRRPRWDLVHMDVQGTEAELCRSWIGLMSERVRYLVVGTHSRKLDGDVLETMFSAGWLLENEKPSRFVFNPGAPTLERMTAVDGTQVWKNPRL